MDVKTEGEPRCLRKVSESRVVDVNVPIASASNSSQPEDIDQPTHQQFQPAECAASKVLPKGGLIERIATIRRLSKQRADGGYVVNVQYSQAGARRGRARLLHRCP